MYLLSRTGMYTIYLILNACSTTIWTFEKTTCIWEKTKPKPMKSKPQNSSNFHHELIFFKEHLLLKF